MLRRLERSGCLQIETKATESRGEAVSIVGCMAGAASRLRLLKCISNTFEERSWTYNKACSEDRANDSIASHTS
jgi:hypothetical protein